MVCCAERNSWAFDLLFWGYLDPEYFGEKENGDYHARLPLLTRQQLDAMEPFVKLKMKQKGADTGSLGRWRGKGGTEQGFAVVQHHSITYLGKAVSNSLFGYFLFIFIQKYLPEGQCRLKFLHTIVPPSDSSLVIASARMKSMLVPALL